MAAHVALMRGINLAGKNRLPMKDLSAFSTPGWGTTSTLRNWRTVLKLVKLTEDG